MNTRKSYSVVLSVAGSDSSGGAGIQADIKTFSALGVYGATAITAITAQNTTGVYSQYPLPPEMVYDQIVAVVEDLRPKYVKIGMLSNVDIVEAVAEALGRYSLKIILDPVIVSSSGHRLLSVEAQEAIKEKLFPMSLLVTPNLPEVSALTGMPLTTYSEKEDAARYLMDYGAESILIKGGHEEGSLKTDILYLKSEGKISSSLFTSNTVVSKNIHGTGCTLSSAIAAFMARGSSMADAVARAKTFVTTAIEAGADIEIGQGAGPVNHGFSPLKMIVNGI